MFTHTVTMGKTYRLLQDKLLGRKPLQQLDASIDSDDIISNDSDMESELDESALDYTITFICATTTFIKRLSRTVNTRRKRISLSAKSVLTEPYKPNLFHSSLRQRTVDLQTNAQRDCAPGEQGLDRHPRRDRAQTCAQTRDRH